MKKLLILLFLLSTVSFLYSQIKYEKGYYIDNNGYKTECLIYNVDWKYNPSDFNYKLRENSDEQSLSLSDVKEFGIYNISRYERHSVKIDTSRDELNSLDRQRKPYFSEEELFLKILIEGETSLLCYEEAKFTRFFIKTKENKVEQLIYKRYLKFDDEKEKDLLLENISFKQQLLNNLKCKDITQNQILKLRYSASDLKRIFSKYNQCKKVEIINYEKFEIKDILKIKVTPGINISRLDAFYLYNTNREFTFDNVTTFRIGIETELFLPFHKNKWSIYLEPHYRYFKDNDVNSLISINYQSLSIPVGVRHHFYLGGKNNVLFVNASVNFNNHIDTYFITESGTKNELSSRKNFSYGAGYRFKNKLSLEFRLDKNMNILGEYGYWDSDFNNYSIILGYTIF